MLFCLDWYYLLLKLFTLLGMWEICNKLNICFFGVLFDYRYIKLYIYYDIRVYVYVYMLGILIVKLV